MALKIEQLLHKVDRLATRVSQMTRFLMPQYFSMGDLEARYQMSKCEINMFIERYSIPIIPGKRGRGKIKCIHVDHVMRLDEIINEMRGGAR